jgi:stage II sporulation protein D
MRLRIAFLAALLVLPAAASARTGQGDAPLVSVTTFAIRGHGWGHGVGLAQYGALGYAQHGSTYDQILAHYFPGTELAPAPVAKIRVLLASGMSKLTVTSASPFKAAGADLKAGAYQLGGQLQAGVEAITKDPVTSVLTIEPGKTPLQLDGQAYRGAIQITQAGDRYTAVNVVGLDAYARGVISREMPKDWLPEAQKTQAVAVRSYGLAMRRGGAFDVYADTRDQVYGGVAAETAEGNLAVAATARQVLMFGGKVATTFFYSSSGGRTASSTDVFASAKPVPYLVGVPDPYDTISPYHDWGPVIFTGAQVSKALHVAGVSDLTTVPANDHARQAIVYGTTGDVPVQGSQVRFALGLRSTWFTAGVLTLQRPKGTVPPNTAVTLTGVAKRIPTPVLQQRAVGGTWQPGPALVPAAAGSFTVVVTPTAVTDYRLVSGKILGSALRVPVSG